MIRRALLVLIAAGSLVVLSGCSGVTVVGGYGYGYPYPYGGYGGWGSYGPYPYGGVTGGVVVTGRPY